MEPGSVVGACESAYSCAYSNTVSWRNESTPLPMETRPHAVFERLFGDGGTIDPIYALPVCRHAAVYWTRLQKKWRDCARKTCPI